MPVTLLFLLMVPARYEIAGTIAGDDTILVIPRDGITFSRFIPVLK